MASQRITDQPIDCQAVLDAVRSPECGAGLLFVGTTRQFTKGVETKRLEYEAYHEMAERGLERLEQSARDRFAIVHCRIVHRVGVVELGEISVAVAIGSRHRKEAFEAGAWLMDELKRSIPIWKKEILADGRKQWGSAQQVNPVVQVSSGDEQVRKQE